MSELSRLRWLCRRGMKEHDLLLNHYLENHYSQASSEDQQAFKSILEMTDPELNDLILGRYQSDDQNVDSLLTELRQSLTN